MKFGVFGINFGPCADPEGGVKVAQLAESAGFDSVWTGEHVVLPDPQEPPSPAPPQTPMLDPAVALSFIAANTGSIRLGTGIIILPQRNPLVLAKEMSSVDVLSRGRLMLGVAAGYLHQEFSALGEPFAGRGARTDEYIDAIKGFKQAWRAGVKDVDGRWIDSICYYTMIGETYHRLGKPSGTA